MNKVTVTMEQLEQYGMNMLGQFIQIEAKHDLVTDLVDLKIVFNSTVYGLQAPYEDLRTSQGTAKRRNKGACSWASTLTVRSCTRT